MTEQQEPEKLNAYQVMKKFRQLVTDDIEFFAIAVDYLPELIALHESLAQDPKAADVKALIDEITAGQTKFNIIKQNA